MMAKVNRCLSTRSSSLRGRPLFLVLFLLIFLFYFAFFVPQGNPRRISGVVAEPIAQTCHVGFPTADSPGGKAFGGEKLYISGQGETAGNMVEKERYSNAHSSDYLPMIEIVTYSKDISTNPFFFSPFPVTIIKCNSMQEKIASAYQFLKDYLGVERNDQDRIHNFTSDPDTNSSFSSKSNYSFFPSSTNTSSFPADSFSDIIARRRRAILIFSDANDVLFSNWTREEIITVYNSFDAEIVFSTEANCWPKYPRPHCFQMLVKGYNNTADSDVYLNSGLFIGTAPALLEALAWVEDEYTKVQSSFAATETTVPFYEDDDQYRFHLFYFHFRNQTSKSSSLARVTLDRKGKLFHSMFNWYVIDFPLKNNKSSITEKDEQEGSSPSIVLPNIYRQFEIFRRVRSSDRKVEPMKDVSEADIACHPMQFNAPCGNSKVHHRCWIDTNTVTRAAYEIRGCSVFMKIRTEDKGQTEEVKKSEDESSHSIVSVLAFHGNGPSKVTFRYLYLDFKSTCRQAQQKDSYDYR